MPPLKSFSFSFQLKVSELTEELANRLFEAGCDDALLSSRGEIVSLQFDRTATDLSTALASARADIRTAGVEISLSTIGSDLIVDLTPAKHTKAGQLKMERPTHDVRVSSTKERTIGVHMLRVSPSGGPRSTVLVA